MPEIIIIGAGASGMAAALSAAQDGRNRVTLIERQARAGRKLLSTGNGRCNLSNIHVSPEHYHGAQPEFCVPAITEFDCASVRKAFAGLGLMTVEEEGGRVYPMSGHAGSVVDVLRFALEREGVELLAGEAVESVCRAARGFAVRRASGMLLADKLIVSCGGCAGSRLGGVADGYRLLESLGHKRTALHPALTQIRTEPSFPRALKGIRAEVSLTLLRAGKVLARNRGELLFTDTGVSGIVAFELSRAVSGAEPGLRLALDFFPDLPEEALLRELLRRRDWTHGLPANRILFGTVHNRLGLQLCKAAGISASQEAGAAKDKELRNLCALCKAFPLPVTGVSGFENAQVTAGGIKTADFNPQTMQSRLVPGLYACGEVLDIDGDCGGYNLHWAWASGLLAGRLRP